MTAIMMLSLSIRSFRLKRFLLLLALSCLQLISTSPLSAGDLLYNGCEECKSQTCQKWPRHQDELWLVSTRCLECPSLEGSDPQPEFWKCEHTGGWKRSDSEAFYKSDQTEMTTCFFAHGNRIDSQSAFERGSTVYRTMLETTPDSKGVRFIIWSWPSTKIFGIFRDVHTKAYRSDIDAYYLASFLTKLDNRSQVSLLGYSFGARVVSGAMHILGGGDLEGNQLSSPHESSTHNIRTVLMAPAMHNYWLESDAYHGRMTSRIDRMLVLYNSCDPLLKRYRLISRCERPQALGYTGLYSLESLGEAQHRTAEVDVSNIVGRTHAPPAYFHSPIVMDNVRRYALWEKVDP